VAALAADCQKTVAECEYPRTATDRRYGLMADPKHVVERHVEAFNARDADAEPWSEDADFVAPNASMHGREEVLGFIGVFWDAFPDGRLETSRLLAEGSVVAAEGRFIGTHTGACARRRAMSRPRDGTSTSAGCRVMRFAATSWPRNISTSIRPSCSASSA
jgi:hypothetical protein